MRTPAELETMHARLQSAYISVGEECSVNHVLCGALLALAWVAEDLSMPLSDKIAIVYRPDDPEWMKKLKA